VHISLFDYELPPERIAQEPLPERDGSRLLVLDRTTGAVHHQAFRDLPQLLNPGDLLVVNRSRVFPARLLGQRAGGGEAEVLLVRDLGDGTWDALVRPGRRLRPGATVHVPPDLTIVIEPPPRDPAAPAPKGAPRPAPRAPLKRVRLHAQSGDVAEALERLGHTPLPPYIRRPAAPADRERYQTVFAREAGSVAAPTAGLHFSPTLLAELAARGIERAEIVLHVGPGTFRPVEVERVEDHRVDPEPYAIPPETALAIARARARGRRVVAVGTTATRALETAAGPDGAVAAGGGETALVIVPGRPFRTVDALVTNFHLPRSSLLLLVAAFAGRERVLAAYAAAVHERYRFYSYGDAMLIR
jgi:S-adenosylmethionine:tRNA ribosyltransferase-isomerase